MQNVKLARLERDECPWAAPRADVALSNCYFYHTIEFPDGRVARGEWDLCGRFADYVGRVSVAGARVLDVGTASGFLTFSAEAAGAAEVVSFDLDTADRQHLLPQWDSLYVRDHRRWVERQTTVFDTWKNAYWYAHQAKSSKARVVYGDVYSLPAGIGTFDIVILGAILEHLGDPVRAIGAMARVADELIVVNTDIMDGTGSLARFNGRAQYPENDYIFWTYTLETYEIIFEICGFKIETVRSDTYFAGSTGASGERLRVPRTSLVARRVKGRRS